VSFLNLVRQTISDYSSWQQKETEARRIRELQKQRETLQSGPVIVTVNRVFHKARSCNTYGRAGGQVKVQSLCPNPDPDYRPHGSYTTSRRSPNPGNASYATAKDAIDSGNRPCSFCYSGELQYFAPGFNPGDPSTWRSFVTTLNGIVNG
jgi:hypothetical protein